MPLCICLQKADKSFNSRRKLLISIALALCDSTLVALKSQIFAQIFRHVHAADCPSITRDRP